MNATLFGWGCDQIAGCGRKNPNRGERGVSGMLVGVWLRNHNKPNKLKPN